MVPSDPVTAVQARTLQDQLEGLLGGGKAARRKLAGIMTRCGDADAEPASALGLRDGGATTALWALDERRPPGVAAVGRGGLGSGDAALSAAP